MFVIYSRAWQWTTVVILRQRFETFRFLHQKLDQRNLWTWKLCQSPLLSLQMILRVFLENNSSTFNVNSLLREIHNENPVELKICLRMDNEHSISILVNFGLNLWHKLNQQIHLSIHFSPSNFVYSKWNNPDFQINFAKQKLHHSWTLL